VRLRSNDTYIEVTALADDLFRVGMFGDGRRIDYRSEAVAKSDWAPPAARIKSAADEVHLSTETTTAKVALDPLRIAFTDGQQDFAVDDAKRGMGFFRLAPAEARVVDPLGAPAILYKEHQPDTH